MSKGTVPKWNIKSGASSFGSVRAKRPASQNCVETFGTGRVQDNALADRLRRHLDFRPAAIEQRFSLRARPALAADGFYRRLAVYGHFGRNDLDLPWEVVDIAEALASG